MLRELSGAACVWRVGMVLRPGGLRRKPQQMPEARPATHSESGDGIATRRSVSRLRSTAQRNPTDRPSPKALLLAGLVPGGGAAGTPPKHREPEATLVAHREHTRLVFDRL